MTDLDRAVTAVTAAIARKLADLGVADSDAAALEIMAIVRGHGYRLVCPPAEGWKRHDPAPPDPGRPGGAEYEQFRARCAPRQEAGHD